ncbi:MAG: hypothetical protein C0436_00770 [Alphaproteobacteria bacterium]|nr:hypothetical protein [Alphaproteobacteria bacterium]
MGSLRAKLRLIPRALWGFVLAQLLLVILLVSSVGSMLSVSDKEISRAINTQQRVVIDARTGKVLSPLAPKEAVNAELVPAYDVAPSEDEDASEETKDTPADTPPADTAPDTAPTNDAPSEETLPPVTSGSSQALDIAPAPAVTPVPRQNTSLVPGPAPEVSDITDNGVLPKTDGKDITPARIYARRFVWAEEDQKPAVAVLVMGLGMNPRSMQAALALPPEVGFSITPYGDNSALWVEWARNDGHEVWLEMPSQTTGFPRTDPGPYGIFKGIEAPDIVSHMHKAMVRFSGYVGFALPLEQAILPEASVAVTLLEELSKRGLLLAVATSAVDAKQIPHIAPHRDEIIFADSVLDSTPSEAFIRARLAKIEANSKTMPRQFIAVSDTPLSLQILGEWAGTLKTKNIVLVPPSALTRTAADDAPPPPPKEEKKEGGH